jgi:hypothetical protein
MVLKFPDLDTLKLALTSGAVPPGVSQSSATARFDDDGRVWVETPSSLPKAAFKELKRLGVRDVKADGAALTTPVGSWLELLPLHPDPAPLEKPDQTPVLFDVGGAELSGLINEMLRLGNDRQSFRWLRADDDTSRALLRVFGPPYYSLLRALGRQGKPMAPVAYVERAPRVWIELGQTHPLAARIKAPDGKLLLLRSPRHWTVLDDAPFRDVYEVLDFALPAAQTSFRDTELSQRIRVPLSLRAGASPEGAELWVLRDDAVKELTRFVQNADDQMLGRLRFAVARQGEREAVVVRVGHSKLPPPVLMLPGIGYRSYLKLPNLFLPCGQRLHPPLRRDQVRKLLAEDLTRVVWLAPGEGLTFTPETLPEDAFRPLFDWVDYVLDRDHAALEAWVQASRFDFEAFVCDDDGQPKKSPPPEKKASPRPGPGPLPESRNDLKELKAAEAEGLVELPDQEGALGAVPAEPNAIELRRRALEEEFLQIEGGLDVPQRQQMWPELAALNAAQGLLDDAAACWMNALWPQELTSADYAARWFRAEVSGVSGSAAGRENPDVNGDDVDRLLSAAEPSSADLRALTALLAWAAACPAPPPELVERLNPVGRFLEKHEHGLPVRGVWLAWYHFARLSGGDVLALAHARDRLLERLFQHGLRPERDLPTFLRFAGQPSGQRVRAAREWFGELPDAAKAWSATASLVGAAAEATAAYIDLIFAFGLARLGETGAARSALTHACDALGHQDEVHSFLSRAFEYRIRQALEGKPHAGPLPDALSEELEPMDKMARYVVERLLERSRILEPDRAVDAYRHWTLRDDPLGKELAELSDLRDPKEIAPRALRLLNPGQAPKMALGKDARSRVLRAALDQAPRVGENFGRDLLARVVPTFDDLASSTEAGVLLDQASLLEKGLAVAAHFDQAEHVHPLLERFRKMLAAQQGDVGIQTIESLAAQCFRGLRRLGMRVEIDALLAQMTQVLLAGHDARAPTGANLPTHPAALRALLHLAGGWYYFGRDRQAESVLQKVRGVLFTKDSGLLPKDQSQLASTYALTAGQAPVAMAQRRLAELLGSLPPIRDQLTTQSHYYLLHLNVVESVVLAVVSDDFTMGSDARRWLDDDEYLVRKRIHRDLRTLKENA